MSSLKERVALLYQSHGREVLQFLSVGGMAFAINSAVSWTLMHSIFADGHAKAKVVAGIVATIFSWIANRLWTFREKRTGNKVREAVEFGIVNAIGIGVEAACVLFSLYVLHLTSPTASYISGTIIGTILGTIVRYFLYKFWVFSQSKSHSDDKTTEEKRAELIEEATKIMTGSLPIVEKAETGPVRRPKLD
ncbi:GtrA family protein [Rothia nasimurium]|uniref:GtrA family protein n=1 Tax=Rothia nasimurium TaxID=85336 RepID=UPI001F211552|nr:GtrA family protein [Rothia nasimurium]